MLYLVYGVGIGPYNDSSNANLATKDSSLVAKNGATLEKLIVEWNNEKLEVDL